MTTYYHGTTQRGAKSLQQNGIQPNQLQSRDKGFFGEGLYVTTRYDSAIMHAETVAEQNSGTPAIAEITISPKKEFKPGKLFPDNGSITPTRKPEWQDKFIQWYLQKIYDAAVWETIPSASEDDIVSRAKQSMTPTHESFEREDWYPEVTEYAFDTEYNLVKWSESEIIINPQAPITVSQIHTEI